jgi:hypothetical protein
MRCTAVIYWTVIHVAMLVVHDIREHFVVSALGNEHPCYVSRLTAFIMTFIFCKCFLVWLAPPIIFLLLGTEMCSGKYLSRLSYRIYM